MLHYSNYNINYSKRSMTTHDLINLLMALDSSEQMGVYVQRDANGILPISKVYIDTTSDTRFLVIE